MASWVPTVGARFPMWSQVLLIVLSASLPYLNTLEGKYVYDDKVAVSGNPDVYRKDASWVDMFNHDFWGNNLFVEGGKGWTHHSWRPLVVAHFRLDWIVGGGSTLPFHVSNIAYHALSCLMALIAYRSIVGVGSREQRGVAFISALIFSLHPVHTECVANITSRADTVASVFQLAALAVYARGVTMPWEAASRGGRVSGLRHDSSGKAAVGRFLVVHVLLLVAIMCKETTLILPALCMCVDVAASILTATGATRADERKQHTILPAATTSAHACSNGALRIGPSGDSSGCHATYLLPTDLPLNLGQPMPAVKSVSWGQAQVSAHTHSSSSSSKKAKRAALSPGGNGSPDKTARGSTAHQGATSTAAMAPAASTLAIIWRGIVHLPWLKLATYSLASILIYYLRIVIMARGYALASWANPIHNTLYHIEGGAFSPTKLMSIALVQAFALSKLVIPVFLSHEHNALQHVTSVWDPRNLLTLSVWAALLGLTYTALKQLVGANSSPVSDIAVRLGDCGGACKTATPPGEGPSESTEEELHELSSAPQGRGSGSGSGRQDSCGVQSTGGYTATTLSAYRIMFGLAFVAVSYFPSSHILQYVAFLLAERTLYLPSFGAALLIAECILLVSKAQLSVPHTHTPPQPQASARVSATPRKGGGGLISLVGLTLLFVYYIARSVTRNREWSNEEILMESNLQLYPAHNTMTVYGLGAVALYKGDTTQAEVYLKQAINESSMVEPRILLSQLYWKYYAEREVSPGVNGYAAALTELKYVSQTSSPRREILTNLGMLQYRILNASDEDGLKEAEYNILAAQVAHGYPIGHHSLALLATNAGCVRLMSQSYRYGDPGISEVLMNEALAAAREGGTPAAFRNAATFYILQGYDTHALSIIQEGYEYALGHLKSSSVGGDAVMPGSQQIMVQYFSEMANAFQRLNLTVTVYRSKIVLWSLEKPVVGVAVEQRMKLLGIECYMELLWW